VEGGLTRKGKYFSSKHMRSLGSGGTKVCTTVHWSKDLWEGGRGSLKLISLVNRLGPRHLVVPTTVFHKKLRPGNSLDNDREKELERNSQKGHVKGKKNRRGERLGIGDLEYINESLPERNPIGALIVDLTRQLNPGKQGGASYLKKRTRRKKNPTRGVCCFWLILSPHNPLKEGRHKILGVG